MKIKLPPYILSLLFIFLVTTENLYAQATSDALSNVTIQNNNEAHKLDINFNAGQVIQNLLVIVSDSLGETVFLDNQYRFKGNYVKSVDLSNSPKGEYSVKVISDDEKINKKIRMQ
jgi:hypothetical protein